MSHFDSPASMSMHEEARGAVNRPMMGVFNNLVMFDQHVAQNTMASIVPDLATAWSWSEEGTELTLPLRRHPEVDALIDRQSMETDLEKRRRMVWDIERKLIEDDVRPVLFHPRGAVCNQPWVKDDADGQRHLQRLALRGRLAGKIAVTRHSGPANGPPADEGRKGPK
jgi:ABC-type transport system substrate-binding protein